MKLKAFVPDWDSALKDYHCTPLLYPFLHADLSREAIIKKYGDWVPDMALVNTIEECDVAILKYEMGYYYAFKKTAILKSINAATVEANKLLICTVKGDAGITPPLQHFHLYRPGGYASKNMGNQFALPVFIADPLLLYNDRPLFIHHPKTTKPLIGFCGQGRGNLLKWGKDILRIMYQRAAKLSGKRFDDNEPLQSSTYTRSQLLDALEKSPLVETNFIRHKQYRSGATTKEEKEASAKLFFHNILNTQYTLCYRGTGNFSVRLYETMACGRIPIMVRSDNLLPLPDKIDWNKFPVIQTADKKNIAQQIAAFHNSLDDGQFAFLQQYARQVWEQYLRYSGFMHTFTRHYQNITAAQHSHLR